MWSIILVAILLICGVLLLVAELFLLPGFGIAGVGGFISLACAVGLAYWQLAAIYPLAGHITLCIALLLTLIAVYLFFRSRAIEKMGLDTTIDSSVSLAEPGKKIDNLREAAEKDEKKETINQ